MVYKASIVNVSHLSLKNLSNRTYYGSHLWCNKTETKID